MTTTMTSQVIKEEKRERYKRNNLWGGGDVNYDKKERTKRKIYEGEEWAIQILPLPLSLSPTTRSCYISRRAGGRLYQLPVAIITVVVVVVVDDVYDVIVITQSSVICVCLQHTVDVCEQMPAWLRSTFWQPHEKGGCNRYAIGWWWRRCWRHTEVVEPPMFFHGLVWRHHFWRSGKSGWRWRQGMECKRHGPGLSEFSTGAQQELRDDGELNQWLAK